MNAAILFYYKSVDRPTRERDVDVSAATERNRYAGCEV